MNEYHFGFSTQLFEIWSGDRLHSGTTVRTRHRTDNDNDMMFEIVSALPATFSLAED